MGFNILEGIPFMLGGFMISAAMSINHVFGKRVTEPSNSLYSMLTMDSFSKWRSSFIAGMLFTATLMASQFGFDEIGSTHIKPFESAKLFFKGTGLIHFMISGLLIGLGTRLANGGLTKYAFYGIPKLERQSMVATGTVLAFAAITATLRSNFTILQGLNITKKFNEHLDFKLSFFIPLAILIWNLARNSRSRPLIREILIAFGTGSLLSLGMLVSGLARRHQVLDFLSLNGSWNPFFLFVVGGVMLGNSVMFNLFKTSSEIEDSPSGFVSLRMLAGCSLFGMGLGMSGLSLGSGLLVAPIYLPQVALFFLPFIIIGQLAIGAFDKTFRTGASSKSIGTYVPSSVSKTLKMH